MQSPHQTEDIRNPYITLANSDLTRHGKTRLEKLENRMYLLLGLTINFTKLFFNFISFPVQIGIITS